MEDFDQNIQNQLILTFVIVADRIVAQIDNAENRTTKIQQNGLRVEQWINLKYLEINQLKREASDGDIGERNVKGKIKKQKGTTINTEGRK